jgi:hypothetical protein
MLPPGIAPLQVILARLSKIDATATLPTMRMDSLQSSAVTLSLLDGARIFKSKSITVQAGAMTASNPLFFDPATLEWIVNR